MAKAYSGGTLFKPSMSTTVPRTDSGYDVRSVRLHPGRRAQALSKANAVLHDGTSYVPFFCARISEDLGLGGSTAQSRYVRDRYAHNVELPSLQVYGEVLDQDDYGTLVEFIRQAQRKGIDDNTLTQISITQGGSKGLHKIKGYHKPILAQGYVKAMPRHHEKEHFAPVFTFEFVVAEMLPGSIYAETTLEEPAQRTWAQILNALVEQPTDNKPIEEKVGKAVEKTLVELGDDLEDIFKGF